MGLFSSPQQKLQARIEKGPRFNFTLMVPPQTGNFNKLRIPQTKYDLRKDISIYRNNEDK